ncbi:MAG: DUF6020 family protein [Candidatus Saccharibacteria bacterium]|nr:DUF6020 family protein [Candidatus Saccharibacteria bacterium]
MRKFLAGVFGIFWGILLVIGRQLENSSEIKWDVFTILKILVVSGIVGVLMNLWLGRKKESGKGKIGKRLEEWGEKVGKMEELKIMGILVIPLVVVWLVAFPGVFGYDTIFQLRRWTSGVYDTHYPIPFIWLMGGFISLGETIFQSREIGYAGLILLQILAVALVEAKGLKYFYERTKNGKVIFILMIFFMTHLPLLVLSVSGCHDVLFGVFFAGFLLGITKWVNEERVNILLMILLGFLMGIFRSNGLFAMMPMVVIGVIILRGRRGEFLGIMSLIIGSIMIFNGPILDRMGVKKLSLWHESMNLPVMQMTRSYVMNRGIWTEKERKAFENFYPKCDFEYYRKDQGISDNFKKCANDKYMADNFGDYLGLWMRIGMKDFQNYAEAMGLLDLGVYYPWKKYPDTRIYHPWAEWKWTKDEQNGMEIRHLSGDNILSKIIGKMTQGGWFSRIPILRVLWGGGILLVIFTMILTEVIYRKKWKQLVGMSLVAGLLVTIVLAPVIIFRYMVPVVLVMPIIWIERWSVK